MTLIELEGVIRRSWSADTADKAEAWTADNPARGQCAVTALVVREWLGGEIVIAPVGGALPGEHHAWNRLPSGLDLDLTRDQFRNGEVIGMAIASGLLHRIWSTWETVGVLDRAKLLSGRVRTAWEGK